MYSMTPADFKNSWSNPGNPLFPIAADKIFRFGLLKSTVEFLTNAGLPRNCEPNLSFATEVREDEYHISKLTDQYEFEEKENFDRYIVIGYCRDGNIIAIDSADNDCIVQLDHEDKFASMYFNRSIASMASFLILYRDFEQEVIKDKDPDDGLQVFNFTDSQMDEFKKKMLSVDPGAVLEKGFWQDEIEIMVTLRKEQFGI